MNIKSAFNLEQLVLIYRFDETINAFLKFAMLQQIEQACPNAPRNIVFLDSARYYKSEAVAEFLETSRIQLEPLPPYSPADPYTHLTPPPPVPRLPTHESLRPMVRHPPA